MIDGLTVKQTQILTRINVITSSLSFCGSFFIVLCYLIFKDLRKFSFQLIFYLSLSDMFCSLFNMLGNPGEGILCHLQGYATQFFLVASILWTTTIAFTLFRTVVKHKTDFEVLGIYFHIYVWSTSLLVTILPMVGSDYGPAGAWCWVQNETSIGKTLRFITFYVPLWSAIIFNGTVYFQVIRMLSNATRMASMVPDRRQQDSPSGTKASIAINKWGYYPLILIGCWFFATINKIYDLFEHDHPLFWLYCLQIATSGLMGLFNTIAYGFNSAVRKTLSETANLYSPEWLKRFMPLQPLFVKLEVPSNEESELAILNPNNLT